VLSAKEIHLLISQGLNTLGIFTERANLFEQIDKGFMHVIVNDINRLLNLDVRERNAIDTQLAKELSSTVHSELAKEDRYYTTSVPTSFLSTKAVEVEVAQECCVTDEKTKGFYRANSLVTYNGQQKQEGEIFYISDYSLITYGKAQRLKTKWLPAILVDAEFASFIANGKLLSRTAPVVNLQARKLFVTNDIKKTIPVSVSYYALQMIDESKALSWCSQKTLELPRNLQDYYIDKVIAYLAIIMQNPQQNIVNLNTVTL
jgi:hypothetical protein